jgi:hypothetical protein
MRASGKFQAVMSDNGIDTVAVQWQLVGFSYQPHALCQLPRAVEAMIDGAALA